MYGHCLLCQPAVGGTGTDRTGSIFKDNRTDRMDFVCSYVCYAGQLLLLHWYKKPRSHRNIVGGQATLLVDGLQFVVAILLMILGVLVAFSCLKKLFTAKKQENTSGEA